MENQRSLHIVHIASGDLWAGAEVQLYTLCKALQKLESTRISVILLNKGELATRLKQAGIPVTIFEENQFNGLRIFGKLYNWLRINQPDIVHTHRNKENTLGDLVRHG